MVIAQKERERAETQDDEITIMALSGRQAGRQDSLFFTWWTPLLKEDAGSKGIAIAVDKNGDLRK